MALTLIPHSDLGADCCGCLVEIVADANSAATAARGRSMFRWRGFRHHGNEEIRVPRRDLQLAQPSGLRRAGNQHRPIFRRLGDGDTQQRSDHRICSEVFVLIGCCSLYAVGFSDITNS